MKLIKLRLVLDVDIDPQGESDGDLKHMLSQVARDAVNNGTLTGAGPATVERYEYTVKARRKSK